MTGFRFTKQTFIVLTVLIAVGLAVAYQGTAEEKSSTLSGRVINTKGEPIAEASIALLYVKIGDNGEIDTLFDRVLYPFLRQRPTRIPPQFKGENVPHQADMPAHPPFLKSRTDSEGRFTFTDIATGMVQLIVLAVENEPAPPRPAPQNFQPLPEIQTIKFGEVAFHPHEFSFLPLIGAVTFAIKSGANIENVEVKMGSPLKIQGRVVFKNGEPLADTSVAVNIGTLGLDGTDGFAFSRSLDTDVDGHFVFDIHVPGAYALSVNYRGLSTAIGTVVVKMGEPHEVVALTLDGNSADLSASPPESLKEHRHALPDVPGMWIVNPANGHAYKWIACDNREDAQVQAADEGAHLVTITSEAEQIWLEAVFGPGPFWLGLTDVLKEGEWLWETGEAVTYTNWQADDEHEDVLDEPPALLKAFGAKNERQRHEAEREDYAIMSSRWNDGEIGKWWAADSNGAPRRGRTHKAILEKDGLRAKLQVFSSPDADN